MRGECRERGGKSGRKKEDKTISPEGDPLQEEVSLPSLRETLMFLEVWTQTSFFPLSEESPWRVLGERKQVQAKRGGEGRHEKR